MVSVNLASTERGSRAASVRSLLQPCCGSVYGAIATSLIRDAMLRPAPGQKGFDFVIPLALENGQLSAILIQVKNNKSDRIDCEVPELLTEAAKEVIEGEPGLCTGALHLALQLKNGNLVRAGKSSSGRARVAKDRWKIR